MLLIESRFQPRVVNTLAEPPEPRELLIVDPGMAPWELAMLYEALFHLDDGLDPEP
jgi:hypothetical protein